MVIVFVEPFSSESPKVFVLGTSSLLPGSIPGSGEERRDPVVDVSGAGHLCVEEEIIAQHMAKEERRILDRSVVLAIITARRAMDRTPGFDALPTAEVGCSMGTTFAGSGSLESFIEVFRTKGPRRVNPRALQMTIGNATASNVSISYALNGPTITCSGSFLSGLHAFVHAAEGMSCGSFPDYMLAGAAESPISAWVARFASIYGLSGVELSEGAAMAVLEKDMESERVRPSTARWMGCGLFHAPSSLLKSDSGSFGSWFKERTAGVVQSLGLEAGRIARIGVSCSPGGPLTKEVTESAASLRPFDGMTVFPPERPYTFSVSALSDLFTFLEAGIPASSLSRTGEVLLFASAAQDGNCAVLLFER